MRLKLTLARADGTREDIVVTADASVPIGWIAQAIAERDPGGPRVPPDAVLTLARLADADGGRPRELARIPATAPLGEAPLASGARVAVVDGAAPSTPRSAGAAVLEVVAGDSRRRVWQLPQGTSVLGRASGCDVVLEDRHVSGRHARIEVSDVVEIIDLGSANGLELDGELVARLAVRGSRTVTVGSTTLRVTAPTSTDTGAERQDRPGPAAGSLEGGPVCFNRAPRVEPRYAGEAFRAPPVEAEPEPSPFAWPMLLAPIALGVALAVLTGRPLALLFVLMTPAMIVGGHIVTRRARRRARERAHERFEARLRELRFDVDTAFSREREVRAREAPSVREVVAAAHARTTLLWTRRPEHWSFLNLRLGTGVVPSRSTLECPPRGELPPELQPGLDDLEARMRDTEAFPIVENLHDAGSIGCAGGEAHVGPILNGILAQLVGLHSPSEVALAAIVAPSWGLALDWLKWTPHVSSPNSPLGERPHLAASAASAGALLAAIEELVEARLGAASASPSRRGPIEDDGGALARGAGVGSRSAASLAAGSHALIPAIVVVITDDAPVERSRLVRLAEIGPDAGVYPIWVAPGLEQLPAACRSVVDVREPGLGAVGLVRLGTRIEPARLEPLAPDHAMDLGRALAPVVDSGAAAVEASDTPKSVALSEALGPDVLATSAAVLDRWREHDSIGALAPADSGQRPRHGRLRAFVGIGPGGVVALDLRAHGPHALVAGTTGAGKSEFLQAWVLGLATEYSPDRVTFLLVDYKGGSAFADCVRLPHCVGLVTDLGPHLVRRALTSLRAELRHRERLLERAGAKDLIELERRGEREAPPALVLVVDEFAALARDVPEFVDGVVDLAQRGRSLGIHLILATQRPAGVVTDHVRSNANLRIALRMGDERDSLDVVGVRDAAGFDPAVPGRALARLGPGVPVLFQAAFPGARASARSPTAGVDVAPLRLGGGAEWPARVRLAMPRQSGLEDERTEQQRLVDTVAAAATEAGIRTPRRPWLDELPPILDVATVRGRDDARLVFGVCDDPGNQRRVDAVFRPDVDGHIAFIGTGGSGKSVALRTLAIVSAATPDGGPVHVYALDFASGGLRILERLPHVGAVISADDAPRVHRLLRTLRGQLEERARRYAAVSAADLSEYRRIAGRPQEPRVLVLLDGFPAFRDEWELAIGRADGYDAFREVLATGRRLGIHVALTADRPAALPPSVAASVPRRVALRLADDSSYAALGAPRDVLSEASPPGRAIVDGLEAQIAVIGGHVAASDQADALRDHVGREGRRMPAAPPIETLPELLRAADLPARVGERPALGLGDATLAPVGFDPVGTFLLAGPPMSGRSNALAWIVTSLRSFNASTRCIGLNARPSDVLKRAGFDRVATTVEEAAALADETLRELATGGGGPCVLVVEAIADFVHTPAESAIGELVGHARRGALLLVAENETSGWGGPWPMLAAIKQGRRGLLLQPDLGDGDLVLRTALPRAPRSDFPVGRGIHLERGTATVVQVPHMGGRE